MDSSTCLGGTDVPIDLLSILIATEVCKSHHHGRRFQRESAKPWVDRNLLISQAAEFVQKHGFVVRRYAKRISGLVEIAVYNSIVSYYEKQQYTPGGKVSWSTKVI